MDCSATFETQNESGYCSDASPMSSRVSEKAPNLKRSPDELSEYDECSPSKKRLRQETKMLNIKVKLARDKVFLCQTNGRETILEMIKKKLRHEKIRKATKHMLFKSSSNVSMINLGLPTGILKENEQYECIYKKKLSYKTDVNLRKIDVSDFDDSWEINYFYVKFDKNRTGQPNVTRMSNIAEVLQVPFFKGERFVDALLADKRFDQKKNRIETVRTCQFKNEKGENISLIYEASVGNFEFYPSKADPIEGEWQPLTKPLGPLEEKPSYHVAQGASNVDQGDAVDDASAYLLDQSSPIKSSKAHKEFLNHTDPDNFKNFIEGIFNIKLEKEQSQLKEKKRLGKIRKFFKKGYSDHCFALGKTFSLGVSHVEKLAQLCHSTGAIVIQLTSGEKKFMGTCFRIGPNYVMTCQHVLEAVCQYQNMLKILYIDFSYTSGEILSSFLCTGNNLIVQSNELDYAIIKVEPMGEKLPPSVTSLFSIPLGVERVQEGVFLTLSGHPEGSNQTMTDLLCPLKHPESIDKRLVCGLTADDQQQFRDQRRQTYDVSTFFYGSSGSPGVLLQDGYLLMMHCRKYPLGGGQAGSIEQGVLIAAIVQDVINQRGADLASELFDLPKDTADNFPFQVTELD